MPILSDDMLQQCQKQLSDQVWQEEVVARLPAETEAQARALRAFLYKRAFASACDRLARIALLRLVCLFLTGTELLGRSQWRR